MNLVTLDFETYYDKEYSLKKLTTEEYVRDLRFKAYMAGVRLFHGHTQVVTTPDAIHNFDSFAVVAHHAHFDSLILSHHYNIRPKFIFCTLSMARLLYPHDKSHSLESLAKKFNLGGKTMDYISFEGVRDLPPDLYTRVAEGCRQDVELTHQVFQKLLPQVPPEELRLIDLTVRMFTEPALTLDRPLLENYLTEIKSAKEKLLAELQVTKADLQSSEKFAGLLRSLGVEPPMKPSPKHPNKQIYAFAKTDEGMKQLLEDDNETVATLAAARLGQKSTIGETRAQRLLDMESRGRLCVYLKYCGAHTTRWSGADGVNWQNLPRQSAIRKSVTAPAGYKLVIIDLAQIEFRVLMWLAGQDDALEALRQGRDIYCETASRYYGREITKADKKERQFFKAVVLGCGYGMGAAKFQAVCKQAGMVIDEHEAKHVIQFYRQQFAKVPQLWKFADSLLPMLLDPESRCLWRPMMLEGQRIGLPNDTYLDYSHITYHDNEFFIKNRYGESKIYGAKLVENVVQSLARVVLGHMMVQIAAKYKVVLTCHDEIVFLAAEHKADEALTFGLQVMKTPPPWAPDLPLEAEGIVSERYSK